MAENERTEYKEKLTAALEKEAVVFLNVHGGTIYIGIDRNGNPVGVDKCDALQWGNKGIIDRVGSLKGGKWAVK
ncbi:MAG: ATP-binding protein [Alphaproteobacteria bacterium]|nr:ATP-binding protein [Alphaproteobacteria bacterium]